MNPTFSPIQRLLITWLLILITGWITLNAFNYLGELISVFVTAGLIAFLLNYAVDELHRFLPRSVAAAFVYLVAGVGVAVLALTVAPPVLNQARQLTLNLPSLLESGMQQLETFQTWSQVRNLPFNVEVLEQQLSAGLQDQAQGIAAQGLGLVLGTFNWVLDSILVLVISFYMLVDRDRVWSSVTGIFSVPIRNQLSAALQRNLQRFFSGQLLLGLFMTLILTPIFWLLRVPFFLLFAVFIGLTEIIPFIGATLGIATVSIVVAFIDLWLALQVVGVAIAVQQVKDNLVAPRIMGNLTGLSPVIIFGSLLLGAKFGGFLGVVLAIPLTGVVKSMVEVVVDPELPPQTGPFFYNPLETTQPASAEEAKPVTVQHPATASGQATPTEELRVNRVAK